MNNPLTGHWSPFEHCAKAMDNFQMNQICQCNYGQWSGNFKGFIQYRKMFEEENKIV